jgi:hypothetical protein
VLWCHNGNGAEAPVAAALGKLDGFNLFDPCWKELEYRIWYHLLNCGIALPASTGSDWFICSNNRVYVQTGEGFTYRSWLEGLRDGRTFITNGPALFLEADGHGPGSRLDLPTAGSVAIQVEWRSHYPVTRIEVVRNGEVVARRDLAEGADRREGTWRVDVDVPGHGWIAARAYGEARDSFLQPVYAHTSPVYVGDGPPPDRARESAAFFLKRLDESSEQIGRFGRFTRDEQRQEVLHLFREARKVYAGLAG